MKVMIIGAGAVGGFYGARLALAGHDVAFIVRTPSSVATLQKGLRIRSELGDLNLPSARALTDPRETGGAQLVILAVKLWDTEAALKSIVPVLTPATTLFSLQNGVDKDEVVSQLVGPGHVVGAVTYIVVNRNEDGVIVHSGQFQRIIIGELDGTETQRIRDILSALRSAGIDADASPDIRRSTWEKFIFLASISGITASTRQTVGTLRSGDKTRSLLQDAMNEAAALARAEGVTIAEDFVEERMQFVDTLPAEGRSSMANDLIRGSRLELEWLSGAVVKRGKRFGLSMPVHSSFYTALAPFASGR